MRHKTGSQGEALCAQELRNRGWDVEDLNETIAVNYANADLRISKGDKAFFVQVKASKKARGYITGGSVNPSVIQGGPIFNRSAAGEKCQFVIFIASLGEEPRFFIVPVERAETLIRRNIEAYWLTPKLDGTQRKPYGQSDIFVGGGKFPHSNIVPDQRDELAPFEDRWDILT